MRTPPAEAAAGPAAARRRRSGDEAGEALPVAILFLGVLFTILLGVHVVVIAMARTAVQAAADSALSAAQVAGRLGEPGDCGAGRSVQECQGILGARLAMAAAKSSIVETRPPAVVVEEGRGTVTVLVFGGTITPLLGGVELTAQACGPLDDVWYTEHLNAADAWRC